MARIAGGASDTSPGRLKTGAAAPSSALRRRPKVTAVGAFLPSLTRKAFEKYGFSTAALLTDWSAIVGADLAVYTLPERLRWPKGVEAYGEVDDAARGRPGATLVLRVDGARVLDVQYQRAQIIDRINAYFGYRAIKVRFVIDKLVRRSGNA